MFVNISSDPDHNSYVNTEQICQINEFLKPTDRSVIIYQLVVGNQELYVSKKVFQKLTKILELEEYKRIEPIKVERRSGGLKTMDDLEKELKQQWG